MFVTRFSLPTTLLATQTLVGQATPISTNNLQQRVLYDDVYKYSVDVSNKPMMAFRSLTVE